MWKVNCKLIDWIWDKKIRNLVYNFILNYWYCGLVYMLIGNEDKCKFREVIFFMDFYYYVGIDYVEIFWFLCS